MESNKLVLISTFIFLGTLVSSDPSCTEVAETLNANWESSLQLTTPTNLILEDLKGPWVCRRQKPVSSTSASISFALKHHTDEVYLIVKTARKPLELHNKLLWDELGWLKANPHPNIIRPVAHLQIPSSNEALDNQGGVIYQLLEPFAYTPLTALLKQRASLLDDPRVLMRLFDGVLAGVAALHSKNLVHTRLDLTSIFVKEDLTPKIGNLEYLVPFGTRIEARPASPFSDLSGIMQTTMRALPATDIWALGVLLYDMTHRVPLLDDKKDKEGLKEGLKKESVRIRDGVERTTALLIGECLRLVSSDRSSVAKLRTTVANFLRSDTNQYIQGLDFMFVMGLNPQKIKVKSTEIAGNYLENRDGLANWRNRI